MYEQTDIYLEKYVRTYVHQINIKLRAKATPEPGSRHYLGIP